LNVTGLPHEKKKQVEHISNALLNQIESGLIKSRYDIVSTLQGSGFHITRKAKNTISIKDPNGGKNIKLKGAIYEETFQFSGNYAERIAADQASYTARKSTEFERNKTELTRLCRAKSERNKQLYQVHTTESEQTRNKLQGIIQSARERGAETHRISDQLSHIQDVEIQRSHSFNIVSVRVGDGGSRLLDGGNDKRECISDTSAEQNLETGWGGVDNIQGQGLSNYPEKQSNQVLRKRQQPTRMGIEIDDRARNALTERIDRIIQQSRDYVSRVQGYFGEVGQSVLGATDLLREFTARKQKSDSVSNSLNRASERFNESAKQIIKVVENKLEQDRKPTFRPKFF